MHHIGGCLTRALWLLGGAYGTYGYFRHREYVRSLPADPENDALKRKHRAQLVKSIAFLLIGIVWAFKVLA